MYLRYNIAIKATNKETVTGEVNHVPNWKTQYHKHVNLPKLNL